MQNDAWTEILIGFIGVLSVMEKRLERIDPSTNCIRLGLDREAEAWGFYFSLAKQRKVPGLYPSYLVRGPRLLELPHVPSHYWDLLLQRILPEHL